MGKVYSHAKLVHLSVWVCYLDFRMQQIFSIMLNLLLSFIFFVVYIAGFLNFFFNEGKRRCFGVKK
uniref:Uncharacterized protein n=1 Tax=Rhizophora mucronata TaxID=61149 RepID=A0A2P2PS22_RHIMU